MRRDFDKVTVPPHLKTEVLKIIEIGVVVTLVTWVAPKAQRHSRKWLGANKLGLSTSNRPRLFVPRVNRHPETGALDLTCAHRQGG